MPYGKNVETGVIETLTNQVVEIGKALPEDSHCRAMLKDVYRVLQNRFTLDNINRKGRRTYLNCEKEGKDGATLQLGVECTLNNQRNFLKTSCHWHVQKGDYRRPWITRVNPLNVSAVRGALLKDYHKVVFDMIVEMAGTKKAMIANAEKNDICFSFMTDAIRLLERLEDLNGIEGLVYNMEGELIWLASRYPQPTLGAWENPDLQFLNPEKETDEEEPADTDEAPF